MLHKYGEGEHSLKPISVDFWTDTLANLEGLSSSTGIPKNEIIRRGTEISLLLYGVSEKDANHWLLDSLRNTEKILAKRPLEMQELKSELSKTTVLAAALTSVYITYTGRDQPHVLKLYFRALQQHLLVISEPNAKLDSSEIQSIKEDVIALANIVSKLDEHGFDPTIQSAVSAKQGALAELPTHRRLQKSLQKATNLVRRKGSK